MASHIGPIDTTTRSEALRMRAVGTLLYSCMPRRKKKEHQASISTETDPQGTGRVDIHTHPYTTAACAAGVVTKTTDRDSLRYTYNGTRRVRQLALGCESN